MSLSLSPASWISVLAEDTEMWRFLKQSVWGWVALAVLLVVMTVLILWVRARVRGEEVRADAAESMVAQMVELRRKGEISEEEYRSILGAAESQRTAGSDPGPDSHDQTDHQSPPDETPDNSPS